MSECLHALVERAKACQACAQLISHAPRPVFAVSEESRIVIIGQAPGRKVHESGVPWMDASGKRLREWLGVDDSCFYDAQQFALLPMSFCFPGSGKQGDLPPRPECAPLWHEALLEQMQAHRLILLIGAYAQNYYLGEDAGMKLTERVQSFKDYLPKYFPLPHPSPRNRAWLARNPWFTERVLPRLKKEVQAALTE